jgi:hypothetical protein
MTMSLAAEHRRKGLFEPHYWSRPPITTSSTAATTTSLQASRTTLVPLLFPEPLPSITLVDRAGVLRAAATTRTNNAEPPNNSNYNNNNKSNLALPFLHGIVDTRVQPGLFGCGMGSGGGGGGLGGGTVIPVFNGDLLLAVQIGRPESVVVPASRPPSSVGGGGWGTAAGGEGGQGA